MTDTFPEQLLARARTLHDDGLDWLRAHGIAWQEERISQWPSGWGDELHVLLYGDFQAPDATLTYPSLGITIHHEKKTNTIIKGAMTVLEATVKIEEKSVPALIDAAKRINLLLGIYTLHEWGNTSCGWWSWVTHDGIGGTIAKLPVQDGIERPTTAMRQLKPEVRRKVEAAMFWVREPRNSFLLSYKSDILRIYSSYWNAFECLVEAVNILRPRLTFSRSEKQEQIDKFVQQHGGHISVADVEECYQKIVRPGFVGKASHALNICFGVDGDRYVDDCFRLSPAEDRLYDVRNAINHGDIDAENPHELLRVQARLGRLWMIVWRMFGFFIPFRAPVDPTWAKNSRAIEIVVLSQQFSFAHGITPKSNPTFGNHRKSSGLGKSSLRPSIPSFPIQTP